MQASPLFTRRSIRSYTGEHVTGDELAFILDAAYAAPVGMGAFDSLHISVIRNAAFLSELSGETAKAMSRPGYDPFYGAPILIIVSSRFPGLPNENSAYSNAAIAVENMSLACAQLGVGSCLIWGAIRTLNKLPDMVARLNLPEGFVPCCALTVGRTNETYEKRVIDRSRIKTAYLD